MIRSPSACSKEGGRRAESADAIVCCFMSANEFGKATPSRAQIRLMRKAIGTEVCIFSRLLGLMASMR